MQAAGCGDGRRAGDGRGDAWNLAAMGATVVVVDRNADGAAAVAAEIGAAAPINGDVSRSALCNDVIACDCGARPPAGHSGQRRSIIKRTDVIATSDEAWRQIFGVNAGRHLLHKAPGRAAPHAGATPRRHHQFRSGATSARRAWLHCATKGAVHNLTRAMALDHARDGIRILAVCPGEVDTPMLSSERAAAHPLPGRLGRPHHIPVGRLGPARKRSPAPSPSSPRRRQLHDRRHGECGRARLRRGEMQIEE
ncbi:MAG: SDR family oxidoreductase [Caldilineaceae bacterium]